MSSQVNLNRVVPSCKFVATNEFSGNLKDFKGQRFVIYFYPKDNTSGCTKEAEDFNANFNKFKQHNCLVLGLSRDSLKSHENFKAKLSLKFELISDKEETICQLFDVIKEKNMYGRKCFGIERSTFLFDENGKLRQEWRKVKVPGHVDEVLTALTAFDA